MNIRDGRGGETRAEKGAKVFRETGSGLVSNQVADHASRFEPLSSSGGLPKKKTVGKEKVCESGRVFPLTHR